MGEYLSRYLAGETRPVWDEVGRLVYAEMAPQIGKRREGRRLPLGTDSGPHEETPTFTCGGLNYSF